MRNPLLTILLLIMVSFGSQAQQGAATPEKNSMHSAPKSESSTMNSTGSLTMDSAKEADIRHLLELTGAKVTASETVDSMMISIRPLMMNSLPPGDYREKLVEFFFEKFHEKADMGKIVDLAVQAYGRYYTAPEILELIKFYETPLGRKMASVTPKLTSELRDQGQQWGLKLGKECMTEVLNEHPDLAKSLQDAAKAQNH